MTPILLSHSVENEAHLRFRFGLFDNMTAQLTMSCSGGAEQWSGRS